MPGKRLQEKHDKLIAQLKGALSAAVAFSGGVDSTLLLYVAHEVLGDKVVALTGRAPMIPEREIEQARAFCEEHGIRQTIVETTQFDIEGFDENPQERCYLCKHMMFTAFARAAGKLGLHCIMEGSNTDDAHAWRPGAKALEELHIASPLRDAGLSKSEVRALSKELGLSTWDKPSYSCLLSRFEYGQRIDEEQLGRVNAAEEALMELGFSQVRVRVQAGDARIEVDVEDIARAASESARAAIVQKLKELGYVHISLDLVGYRFGSMDEGRGRATT